jgi:diguanylate cyclase (GGDEF)-like protein
VGKIWEFYENMNEIVVVSDIDTDELVYMNRRAREQFDFQTLSELQGKKCYEVLKGCACTYGVCNKNRLSNGEFEEWKYYNPVFGKHYSVKDTIVEENGKRYRLEIAIDMSTWTAADVTEGMELDNDAVINEGLRIALSSRGADASIDMLLEYIGKTLKSERAYIFEERPGEIYANTYEWCAEGIEPQKDNLQNLAVADTEIWLKRFRKKENVIIKNLEDIRESDPFMYDYLLPQDIHSLVTSPLIYKNKIIGFYGVDNPPAAMLKNISNLFFIMGHFISLMLRRCLLLKRLEQLSFYDQLTGAGNRHAMEEYTESMSQECSIGVVYCDVTGLKRVNDSQGHKAGDALLVRACECLRHVFSNPEELLFRVGGDEFLILCSGISEEKLQEKVHKLKDYMKEKSVILAVGAVWRPDAHENIDKLLAEADSYMYEDKRAYYMEHNRRQA